MKSIPKTGPLDATVTAPPSKSYSVRALLLGAMAEGTTTITNCLDADDTRYALEALRTIGFDIAGTFKTRRRRSGPRSQHVGERSAASSSATPAPRCGSSPAGWPSRRDAFSCRAKSGCTSGRSAISSRCCSRSAREVEYVEREGYPPLRIRGKKMRGGFDVDDRRRHVEPVRVRR